VSLNTRRVRKIKHPIRTFQGTIFINKANPTCLLSLSSN